MGDFYGADQARIHHTRFGDLAADAAALVVERARANGHDAGAVVDLGCGSGILAAALIDAGYTVTGVDLSPAMVELARTTAPTGAFTVGSIHDFDGLPADGSLVAVTAIGEVLNYATDARAGLDALRTLAQSVFAALTPGGIFVFDVSTPGRNLGFDVRHVFHVHDHDSWLLGMHATESADGARLDRRIVILVRDPDGRYRRIDEHHTLMLYQPDAVADALRAAGFVVEIRPSYTQPTASTPTTGWAVFAATKPSA